MPTLSACIVVRDGRKSIVKCLDALVPLVDEYVVVDTGSTDGTVELVSWWNGQHSGKTTRLQTVGGMFHDEDGIFDFGAAKNYAVSQASSDYVIWCDVNDIMQDANGARMIFEKIVSAHPGASILMNTRVAGDMAFPRVRIAPRQHARFVGRIHEIMVNMHPDVFEASTRLEFLNIKKTRDIARNIRALAKEWANGRDERTAFYLGNSFVDVKDLEQADTWYSIAVDMFPGNAGDERYKSQEQLCAIADNSGDMDTLADRSLQMISERPERIEGYYYRGKYQFYTGNYAKACKCIEHILDIIKMPNTKLWVDKTIYNQKKLRKMLADAEDRAKYSNLKPLVPDNVTDAYAF